jgi:ankyrin repeat protein
MMPNQHNDIIEVEKSALLRALGGQKGIKGHVEAAIDRNDMSALRALMSIGADPNEVAKDGNALLVGLAEFGGRSEAIDILVEAGANPNVKDKLTGTTPLMRATFSNDVRTMETFINAGARLDEKDNNENTALMYAATWNRIAAMGLLLKAGAKTGEINNSGQTARMIAEKSGFKGIIELLDKHEAGSAADPASLRRRFDNNATGVGITDAGDRHNVGARESLMLGSP